MMKSIVTVSLEWFGCGDASCGQPDTKAKKRGNGGGSFGRTRAQNLSSGVFFFSLGYRYRLHARNLPGCPDIVFKSRQCVVFVNGCFWHGHFCPRASKPSSNIKFWHKKIDGNRERDRRVVKELRKARWRVLTVWQCETKGRIASPATSLQISQ